MKAIAVGSMRPKAAGSGERTSVGVRSGSVRLGIYMATTSAEYTYIAAKSANSLRIVCG